MIGDFLRELSDRRVFRSAAAYAVGAWVLVEVASVVLPTFGVGDYPLQVLMIVLAALFPLAMLLAWLYDIRDGRVERTATKTSQRFGAAAAVILSGLVGGGLYFGLADRAPQPAGAGTESRGMPSIAVLPFDNFSSDEANAMFGQGLAEELINRLANIHELKVIGRRSSFQFENDQRDLREIGRLLNVSNLIEGSVTATGDQIRVTTKLIDTGDVSIVWSRTYDRRLTDIFAIQDDIARSIADSLRVTLLGETDRPTEAGMTDNVDAYRAYLEGRGEWHKRTSASLARAETLFKKALELDEDFALAWSGLADTYAFMNLYSNMTVDESQEKGKVALARALALAPNLAEVQASRGLLLSDQNRFSEAAEAYQRAIELRPNFAMAHMWLGTLTTFIDRERGIELLRKAVELEPLAPITNSVLAAELRSAGRLDEAERILLRVTQISPDFPGAWRDLASLAILRHNYAGSIRYFEKAIELDPGNPTTIAHVGQIYALLGANGEAEKYFDRSLEIGPSNPAALSGKLNRRLREGRLDAAGELFAPGTQFGSPVDELMLKSMYHYYRGDYPQSVELLEKLFALFGASKPPDQPDIYWVNESSVWGMVLLGISLAGLEQTERARLLLTRVTNYVAAEQTAGRADGRTRLAQAVAFCGLGNAEAALGVLREMAEAGWPAYTWLQDRVLCPVLEGEPGLAPVLEKMRANANAELTRLSSL